MKKILILFFAFGFIFAARADDSSENYDYLTTDLLQEAARLCEARGGNFDGTTCKDIPASPPALPQSGNISEADKVLVEAFFAQCQGQYGADKVTVERDQKDIGGLSHTCWFNDLKDGAGTGNKDAKDTKQLKRCDWLNKQLQQKNRVSWHGREITYGAPTERGCYIFTPFVK